jgi:hypothetical protein
MLEYSLCVPSDPLTRQCESHIYVPDVLLYVRHCMLFPKRVQAVFVPLTVSLGRKLLLFIYL